MKNNHIPVASSNPKKKQQYRHNDKNGNGRNGGQGSRKRKRSLAGRNQSVHDLIQNEFAQLSANGDTFRPLDLRDAVRRDRRPEGEGGIDPNIRTYTTGTTEEREVICDEIFGGSQCFHITRDPGFYRPKE